MLFSFYVGMPPAARLRLEAFASPVGGTNLITGFPYPEGRRGKIVPRKRQDWQQSK
jgi:hypothetical protein